MADLKFYLQREPFSNEILVALSADDQQAKVVFEPLEEGTVVTPALRLSQRDAQALMDELWHCGLRPSEGSGSAGALAATQLHLKDMQALTFKLLDRL